MAYCRAVGSRWRGPPRCRRMPSRRGVYEAEQARSVAYDRRFLIASRSWLRDPELARLTLTPSFTDEAQEAWFASLASRADYWVRGLELRGMPAGVFGL